MTSEIKTKKTYNTAISSILGELKYRIIYSLLLATALVTFIYLNFGFYIEFQGSYYLNYYQCIDFCWSEGIKELNDGLAPHFPPVYSKSPGDIWGLSFCADQQGLGIDHKAASGSRTLLGYTSNPALSIIETKLPGQLMQSRPFLASPILIEIDEFKQFFINFVIHFSGQVTFLYDLSASYSNESVNAQDLSQPLVFNFYIILLFYQLTGFLAYHIFCFLSPATTQQFRLKLFCDLQMLFSILLIHFLALPYTISINEEIAIESLDSELFFSANFDLLSSWVKCFYYLLVFIAFFMVYYFYLKTFYLAPFHLAPTAPVSFLQSKKPTLYLRSKYKALHRR